MTFLLVSMKSIRKNFYEKVMKYVNFFFFTEYMCYNDIVIDMRKKNKKNKKRKVSIYKISGLLLLCVSTIFCIVMTLLDILPLKYYGLMVIVFLIINVLIDSFLFKKKIKKRKKNIALGISFLLTVIMIVPIIYMGKTMNFMKHIVAKSYKVENYSVIVLKDSKYNNINDINNQSVGMYENTEGSSQAKTILTDSVDITFKKYDSIEMISQELLDKKIEIIVLEDSILNMIQEENSSFAESIKVIHTFKIKIKSQNEAKDVDVISEPFNIYLTGIDTYGDISSVSRSDVNIIMTVNPKTKQILLTSIPRDYYVELHGKKGSKDKLTHAGIYGTDMSITTIEDLLGIEINYYFKVNFSSFIDIINAIGGIEVISDYSFTSIDGIKYTEGKNKLNGEEALSFARERKAFAEGDRQRGANQQAVIEAVINKLSNKSILTKYDSLLNSIDGKFETNMGSKKITSLIKMQLNDMASWNVISIALDGSNGKGITYSGGNQELYVMIPDWNTVDEASSTIKDVLEGVILDESYVPDKSKSTRKIKSYGAGDVKKATTNTEDNSKKEQTTTKQDEKKEDSKSSENKLDDKKNDTSVTIEEPKDDEEDKIIEIIINKDDKKMTMM
ncbi:MAG: LCP family protein [Bacilli bacterium]|nr:LCP family protein [Bacilli bacterium]